MHATYSFFWNMNAFLLNDKMFYCCGTKTILITLMQNVALCILILLIYCAALVQYDMNNVHVPQIQSY